MAIGSDKRTEETQFKNPDHKDEIVLNGKRISHVEQADDEAIWSTSPEGLQLKLDVFFRRCQRNSMTISVKKTKWMLFGLFLRTIPVFTIDNVPIDLIDRYKYAMFGLEPLIGCTPAKDRINLYMARVDPHLTFGFEVVLDLDLSLLSELEHIQHLFLRRLLGLQRRSMLVILFSETGLLPIRYHRISLALGFLHYLLGVPPTHLAKTALENAFSLSNRGYANWINDLVSILYHLPVPVVCSITELRDFERINKLIDGVLKSCEISIQTLLQTHTRTHFLMELSSTTKTASDKGTVPRFPATGGYVASAKQESKMSVMLYLPVKGAVLYAIFAIFATAS
ncbi:hypothetical protein BT96DRAFT_1025085 [Gymnopus androsaceus JB14]|uniref:Reverse transcriptase domain-containing protein n=1 Tax=Gymnopus androsaceus JB14 TaxID=1447944 RepID=A0A6A4GV61_9AGAR|nr:hypothetical protein BT96DRAFT_1025085 [Gymnopus androsaceus JB14]